MICEGLIDKEKRVEKESYQVTPVETYSGEEEEETLCEAVVKSTGTLPMLIANTCETGRDALRGSCIGTKGSIIGKAGVSDQLLEYSCEPVIVGN